MKQSALCQDCSWVHERCELTPNSLCIGAPGAVDGVTLVVRSRQKHPCGRVNRPTKTRASGYNPAALYV